VAPALAGRDALDQAGIDAALIALDGTPNKAKLGGNATVAVSLAVAHAAASARGCPLWRSLAGEGRVTLPLPEIQIFGGGAHAGRRIDIQDLMVMPVGATSFAQALEMTAEVYRVLQRPATPILPRSSLTMIERHTSRVLERYDLTLADFFEGLDPVIKRVVEEHLAADSAKLFADAEQNMNHELDRLRQELQSIDPTLASALETGRKKINYQLDGLKQRFVRAQMSRDEAAHRQLQRAFDQLYPNKDLQERHINITSLLARHGTYVIEWIFNAINLGSNEHQVVYL